MDTFFDHLRKTSHWAYAAFVFFLLAVVFNTWFSSSGYNKLLFKRFQTRFVQEQNELELRMDYLADFLSKNRPADISFRKTREFRDLASERQMYLFVYEKDSMVLWSDNTVPEADILPALVADHKLVQLANGWYFAISKEEGSYKTIGLVLIKNNYSLQNRFLTNSFNPIFSLPNSVKVKTSTVNAEYILYGNNGKPSFSLWFDEITSLTGWNLLFIIVLYSLAFAFLLFFSRKLIQLASNVRLKLIYLFGVGAMLFFIKFIIVVFKAPNFLFNTSLFQPSHLALSNFLPSLGDLLLVACIIYFLIYNTYTEIRLDVSGKIKNTFLKACIRVVSLVLLIVYFIFANNLFQSVVYNSNLTFDTRELIDIGYISVLGVLSVALLFAGFIFVADYVFQAFFATSKVSSTILISFFTISGSLLFYFLVKQTFDLAIPILLMLSVTIIIYTRNLRHTSFRYTQVILLVLVFSFYSVYIIYMVSSQKAINEKKLLVSALAQEHDPVAEYLIGDLNKRIQKDTLVLHKLNDEQLDFPYLYKYIQKKYFSGYWEHYDLQLTICNSFDSVLLRPELVYQPCHEFFSSLIKKSAEEVKNTGTYYIKNPNGQISYLSVLTFRVKNLFKTNVYVQLDSKLSGDELGYPELLLDERFSHYRKNTRYSYAKYHNNRLIYQSGNFQYNLNSSKYKVKPGEYFFDSFSSYEHIIFRSSSENLLILSKPEVGVFDLLVSFSYLFIFYFIVLNFILLTASPQWLKLAFKGGFKARIRVTVIGVLFLSLISVGGVTIYFIVKQYQTKHYEIISEKLQSIYLELESNLSQEEKITYNWKSDDYSNIEELLRRLSNVFYTDINLYDPNGRMIATSRSEVFDKGLSSTLMNSMAYYQLSHNAILEHIQTERLGNLKYLSVYTPFVNKDNKLLAYLNLPYFTRQSVLTEEISSMLLAIINFYVILILLSLSLAIFISEKISEPLRLIQESFATMKLGKKSEKISYEGTDEIGELVRQYNSMVDELEHSVELLARSERESAWREMAKQVAHEIKNPLTPMKLSIQQLQRAWNDKSEDLDAYFKRVTKTLVEQIENLSNIATEFSNFAKMPKATVEKLDMVALLIDTINLFKESIPHIEFNYDANLQYSAVADKEQLSRVFINLITNALQAIPELRNPEVKISISQHSNQLCITITDNGIGIPESLKVRMFQPNFTTKSGGTGLGLAICKNIIENIGGTITFETDVNAGTSFIIKLPSC